MAYLNISSPYFRRETKTNQKQRNSGSAESRTQYLSNKCLGCYHWTNLRCSTFIIERVNNEIWLPFKKNVMLFPVGNRLLWLGFSANFPSPYIYAIKRAAAASSRRHPTAHELLHEKSCLRTKLTTSPSFAFEWLLLLHFILEVSLSNLRQESHHHDKFREFPQLL